MLRILLGFALLPSLLAADWPQILGPNRDGHSNETGLNWDWAKQLPKQRWSMDVGSGWAGLPIVGDRAYLFNRIDDEEILSALSIKTGQPIWTYRAPTRYRDDFGFDDGPRATPTIDKASAFILGANGDLHAVDLEKGMCVWNKNILKEYGAKKGYFGVASSPVVESGKLIVNVGAKGACLVAFDTRTGREIWKAGDDEASYSSPIVTTISNTKIVIAFTRKGLLGVELENGKRLFDLQWRSRLDASVNASAPLILDGHIFLTASYGTGAILLKCDGRSVEEVWSNDQSLSCQYSTPLRDGSLLFGTDGRADFNTGRLRCINWKTGAVIWSQEKFGCAGLIGVDGKCLAVTEAGVLVAFDRDSKKYSEIGRLPILTGKVRAIPSYARGVLLARDEKKLVCIELKSSAK